MFIYIFTVIKYTLNLKPIMLLFTHIIFLIKMVNETIKPTYAFHFQLNLNVIITITLILASFNYFICPAKYQTFILLFYLLLVGRVFFEFLKQLYTQDFILFKDSS